MICLNNLKIISCGTKYRHKKGFTFSKSTYPDYYLFLFFRTDFISWTKDGNRIGEAYSYILHPPHSKVFHTNTPEAKTGFTNDWVYLKGSYVDELVKKMNILTNVIVPTYDTNKIPDIIQQIGRELPTDYIYKDEYMCSLVTELFIELARNDEKQYVIHDKNAYNAINKARDTMMDNYKNKWTLKSLAKLSGFSQSYFLSLYKSFYKKSPVDDLIDHRIVQAKLMLESNMMNINEIATECGFSTLYYFSRIFRQRTGLSPTEYKKSRNRL